jgi:hypothetical protein
VTDPGVDCPCGCHHRPGVVVHFTACCRRCPDCGRHVTFATSDAHRAWCIPGVESAAAELEDRLAETRAAVRRAGEAGCVSRKTMELFVGDHPPLG